MPEERCACGYEDSVSPGTRRAGNKNGFQAAIPETLRSAARVKIKQARERIAKIRAGYSKIQPLQRLDTMQERAEQKNFFITKIRIPWCPPNANR